MTQRDGNERLIDRTPVSVDFAQPINIKGGITMKAGCFRLLVGISLLCVIRVSSAGVVDGYDMDLIKTQAGDLQITLIGHGTLMLSFGGKVVHIDPWSKLADYSRLPKADLILVTHEHPDHLDPDAIKSVRKGGSQVIVNEASSGKISGSMVMTNGEMQVIQGLKIEAVPAYNLIHMRSPGQPYHSRGIGNGYVLTCGDKRIYVAGDTENTPEMKSLPDIYCAFLPMNLPYTMTPGMVADAAKAMKPMILYPYHTGGTDTAGLVELLKDTGIDVRIRKLQ